MKELVVISANGPDHWRACADSWHGKAPYAMFDTGSGQIPDVEDVGPVWQTGTFLYAYRETIADAFLFTQDTVTVQPGWPDPVEWFRMRMTGDVCAVGWQLFPMDDYERAYVEDWYRDDIASSNDFARPSRGIVGPVFYTTRKTLDVLDELGLLPPVPTTREQQAATERAWAYAFYLARIPLAGEPFVPNEIPAKVTEYGPLRKVWMH
jgi:hypothetical protein